MALIDIHPHVVSADTKRFPLAPIGGHQSDWSQQRPVSYDEMIAAMDQAGVARSAVVQASSAYAFDNSYVAAAVAVYPKRFTGVFSVDVLAPDAVDKMKYWIAKGLTGMRLYTAGSTMPEQTVWFADPKTFPAWTSRAGQDSSLHAGARGSPSTRCWSSSKRALHHRSPGAHRDGGRCLRLRRRCSAGALSERFLRRAAASRSAQRPRAPQTFFARLVREFGANRIAGVQLSGQAEASDSSRSPATRSASCRRRIVIGYSRRPRCRSTRRSRISRRSGHRFADKDMRQELKDK
jgi:hypothetical protein